MGLFDFFKKKEVKPAYDVTNLRVTDLNKGFIFEYDLKSWVVNSVFEYDWGNNYFSKEYKVSDGNEERFLSVDDDDGIFLTFTKKVKIRSISEDLPEVILKNDSPPKKLEYQGTTFYYDGEEIGSFRDLSDKSGNEAKFISWEYYDDDDKFTIVIEQWGDEDFEASFGSVLKEFEISNIIPGEQ